VIRRSAATVTATALASVLLAATLTVTTSDAGAWTDGACTAPSGVTVVVDFQDLGGGVHVRCAPQPVTNGFEALRQAGIEFATTVRFPGFLCRIAGEPASDPCQTTSPATAYWSYWISQRGSTWCYSNQGAGNRTPPAGSVEGWSFSLGRSSATAPPPRAGVPAPLPGTAPAPMSSGDCARRADAPSPAPAPPPTAPPPTRPPATTPPAVGPSGTPVAGPTGDERRGGSTPQAEAPAAGGQDGPGGTEPPAAAAPTIDDPDAEGAADTDVGEDPPADDRERDATRRDEVDDPDAGVALRDEETASIELGGDGGGSGSPLGVFVAVLLMAALTGGALLARRRSRVDTSA
jgi:hypothetical protein